MKDILLLLCEFMMQLHHEFFGRKHIKMQFKIEDKHKNTAPDSLQVNFQCQ